jgi:hypothetical protein
MRRFGDAHSLDPTVRQILAEIDKQGGATGMSFHQRPGAAVRYPTEAILTAVHLLAEKAEAAKDSAMAAGLRQRAAGRLLRSRWRCP